MKSNFYKEIISKLERLIKKEHLAHFLFGLLLTFIIIIVSFSLLSLFELIFHSKSIIRTILFFGFVVISIGSIVYLVILPLLRYFDVFKKWDYFFSADKVGRHFPEIKDDLLNAMQLLSSDNSQSLYSTALIDAAFKNIYERSKPIKFESIVDFSGVKKLSMIFFSSFIFFGFLFLFVPGMQAASYRLVNFNQEFIPPAKFYFSAL